MCHRWPFVGNNRRSVGFESRTDFAHVGCRRHTERIDVAQLAGLGLRDPIRLTVTVADIVREKAGQQREQQGDRSEKWRDDPRQRLNRFCERPAKSDHRQQERQAEIKRDERCEDADRGKVEPGSDHADNRCCEVYDMPRAGRRGISSGYYSFTAVVRTFSAAHHCRRNVRDNKVMAQPLGPRGKSA